MMRKFSFSLCHFLLFLVLFIGCKKEVLIPRVTTMEITNITQNTAKGGGIVTDKGGTELIVKGLCWSTNEHPSVNDSITTDDLITNSFWSTLSDLSADTKYYLRAYATNSEGTGYGNLVTFTTLPALIPIIKNGYPFNITRTSAVCEGEVISSGGSLVTLRGICWSTNENPTINNSKTENGMGIGQFSSDLTGLTPSTTYYVRAYATNNTGTAYSNAIMVRTMHSSLTDIDGNIYKTVLIGTQEWMAENLKVIHYRNGDLIANGNDTLWYNNSQLGAWCSYEDDPDNIKPYGLLYNYFAISDSRGVCPSGWHVPTDSDWTTLINYLGGADIAGFKMKLTGEGIEADNSSGFTALLAGYRNYLSFNGLQDNGYFWSSTSAEMSSYFYIISLSSTKKQINKTQLPSFMGFSIRCLKDN